MKALGLLVLVALVFPWHAARALDGIPVRVSEASVAASYGASEPARIVLHGNFPNASYRLGPCRVWIDAAHHQVRVRQTAFSDLQVSIQLLIPFESVVQVGPLVPGAYEIVDDVSGTRLATFRVNAS